jgi:lipoprotein-anchoring transpeptidase ErfK/SrfK
MRKDDLEELFAMVTVGTVVELVDEPTVVSVVSE